MYNIILSEFVSSLVRRGRKQNLNTSFVYYNLKFRIGGAQLPRPVSQYPTESIGNPLNRGTQPAGYPSDGSPSTDLLGR